MAAAFKEVWKWSGVDEKAAGGSAMIVPYGGVNFVQLEGGSGLVVRVKKSGKTHSRPNVRIVELDDGAKLGELATRRQAQMALRPECNVPDGRRTFAIYGDIPAGLRGAEVEAYSPGSKSVDARLRVIVLKPRPVKISLRVLQTLDEAGKPAPHSKLDFEPERLLTYLNLILTPQTNIVVSLGLTKPTALLDEAKIAKALDLKASKARLPELVSFDRFKDLLAGQRDADAACTIFLMKKVGSGLNQNGSVSREVLGRMDSNLNIGMVADNADTFFYARTLAHEFGHFLGRYSKKGETTYTGFDDLHSDPDQLMHQGGSGWRIPLAHCLSNFNPNY